MPATTVHRSLSARRTNRTRSSSSSTTPVMPGSHRRSWPIFFRSSRTKSGVGMRPTLWGRHRPPVQAGGEGRREEERAGAGHRDEDLHSGHAMGEMGAENDQGGDGEAGET